jgi:hypothetical protein
LVGVNIPDYHIYLAKTLELEGKNRENIRTQGLYKPENIASLLKERDTYLEKETEIYHDRMREIGCEYRKKKEDISRQIQELHQEAFPVGQTKKGKKGPDEKQIRLYRAALALKEQRASLDAFTRDQYLIEYARHALALGRLRDSPNRPPLQ